MNHSMCEREFFDSFSSRRGLNCPRSVPEVEWKRRIVSVCESVSTDRPATGRRYVSSRAQPTQPTGHFTPGSPSCSVIFNDTPTSSKPPPPPQTRFSITQSLSPAFAFPSFLKSKPSLWFSFKIPLHRIWAGNIWVDLKNHSYWIPQILSGEQITQQI